LINPEPKLRFALLGCGRIGQRHLAHIRRHPECALAAIVDPRGAEAAPAGFEGPVFASTAELWTSGIAVDVVVVASPNGLHAPLALEALQQDCHVVLEKPMALRSADAARVNEMARARKRQVFVVMQNRFSPASRWLHNLVRSGRLGRLFLLQVQCFWNRDERYYLPGSWHGTRALDGGTLFTQFSHFLDMMYWLYGDISDIHMRMDRHRELPSEFEDSGCCSFRFQGGGMGSFTFTTAVWDKTMDNSITLIAEHGSLRISGQYMERVDYCHIRDYTVPDDLQLAGSPADNHYQVLCNVVDVIRRGAPNQINGPDGERVVSMIERMYKS